jgi:hypothetical protein
MAKWRVDKTEAREDGSGDVQFEVWGLDDEGAPIPGKHTWIDIDADELQAALDMPTNPQRNTAIKALIAAQLNDAEWGSAALDEVILANARAAEVDENLDTLVDGSFGGYPVTFNL